MSPNWSQSERNPHKLPDRDYGPCYNSKFEVEFLVIGVENMTASSHCETITYSHLSEIKIIV